MTAHSALTGSDLHEPKGVASASANTVYQANGSGSGAWAKITSNNIDTSSIFTTNIVKITCSFTDVGTAGSIYLPISQAGTVQKISTALQGTAGGSDTILTCYNADGASMGTITVTSSGSAAGDIDSLSPASNNTFSAGTAMRIATDGGTSSTVGLQIVIDYLVTA